MKPRAPIDGGRCASRRSTFCQPASSADPGRPSAASFRSVRFKDRF